ncbi:mrp-5 [Bugula neritina]|uniref:Mrp-5 n=1 Tax=Bugula neritina TaxID=10212 RepID=A0A7J7K500_BUGNE|nr:mrp-5 [Bugula neritina]
MYRYEGRNMPSVELHHHIINISHLAVLSIQMQLAKYVFFLRRKLVPITTERVRLTGEIFSSVKVIKMYAWEEAFYKKVQGKFLLAQSLTLSLSQLVPIFSTALTFLVMTLSGTNISFTQAFIYMSILITLRLTLSHLPLCLGLISESAQACTRIKMSVHRLQVALLMEGIMITELKKMNESSEEQLLLAARNQMRKEIIVLTLHDITMSLCQGQLVGVCEAVGSGKSSLLQAILAW